MSPGPTFDRVYLALKEQLKSGCHPPGSQLEPRLLAEELASSITPIRDALHRLVGERLIEAPRRDGFRVPLITEFLLRQLYAWQADLLRLALSHSREEQEAADRGAHEWAELSEADIFLELGRTSGSVEILAALANACDRLAPLRGLEERLIPDAAAELDALRGLVAARDLVALRAAITAYQRRRDRVVPQLVAAFQRPF